MKEIWKAVVGYEGLYEVSNAGGVRSLDKIKSCLNGVSVPMKGRQLKPAANSTGRLQVVLSNQRAIKSCQIHILVLEAFVSTRPVGFVGSHKNDTPTNNNISNLHWSVSRRRLSQCSKGKI